MKKIYLLISLLLPLLAHAQITVTQVDLPVAGVVYIDATDETYSASIPAGGMGQSWNYSQLQNFLQDTLGFISSAGTPYASSFPGANLAGYNQITNSYVYFTSNSTGFYLNGGAAPQGVFVYNPAQMFIPVPFSYQSNYNGHSRFQLDTTINYMGTSVQARFVLYTGIIINGDGYGSLVLPNANINNTLRVRTTSLITDSIYINLPFVGWVPFPGYTPSQNQTTNFKWLRNGNGSLVLEIDADSLGQTATRSSYLLNYVALGTNEITEPVSINTFPNPSNDFVNFNFENKLNDKSTLSIFNQLGQRVEIYDVKQLNTFSMDTLHLPNGLYSYTVQNEKGINAKGKFIVSH